MSIEWKHHKWIKEFNYIKTMLTKQNYDTSYMHLSPKFEENNIMLNGYLFITWIGVAWQGKSLTKDTLQYLANAAEIMIITDKPAGRYVKEFSNVKLFNIEQCYFPIDHLFQPKITMINEDLESKFNCTKEQLPFLDQDDKLVQYHNLKQDQILFIERSGKNEYYRRVKWK